MGNKSESSNGGKGWLVVLASLMLAGAAFIRAWKSFEETEKKDEDQTPKDPPVQ